MKSPCKAGGFLNGYEALTKSCVHLGQMNQETGCMALGRRKEMMAVDEKVVAFPLSGRTATIRRCASELEHIHGEAAVSYWRTECRALAESLAKFGCGENDIREQVMSFQTEVQVEMMRRYSDRLAKEDDSERFAR